MIRVIIIMRQGQDLSRIKSAVDSQEDLTVIGTGTDSYEAIRLTEDKHPDIVVIDCQLDYDGLDIVSLVKNRSPGVSIILFSPYEDEMYALDALTQGVSGYLLRNFDMDILVSIIYIVHAGGYYISQRIRARFFRILPKLHGSGKTFQEFSPGETVLRHGLDFSSLNRTELRIVEFIGQGKSTKEIGETLHLKMGTVRNYISVLMRKSGIHSRLQMARLIESYSRRQSKTTKVSKIFHPVSTSGHAGKSLSLLEASLNLEADILPAQMGREIPVFPEGRP